MTMLRSWLNKHPLGAPYRGLRDLLRISQNRREILEQQRQLSAALQRLEVDVMQRLEVDVM